MGGGSSRLLRHPSTLVDPSQEPNTPVPTEAFASQQKTTPGKSTEKVAKYSAGTTSSSALRVRRGIGRGNNNKSTDDNGDGEKEQKPKTLSEGFWAPGWLAPGELGSPAFEVWPEKYQPSDLHLFYTGKVVFGHTPPHLAKVVTAAKPATVPPGQAQGPPTSLPSEILHTMQGRFHTHEGISGSAFFASRLTRFCIGYQRPREMWRPLHHFCYLKPMRGAWIATYLYVNGTAVCPADHALETIIHSPTPATSPAGNANANGKGNAHGGLSATAHHDPMLFHSTDHYEVESEGSGSGSGGGSDSEGDDFDADGDEFGVGASGDGGAQHDAGNKGSFKRDGKKSGKKGIHQYVERVFHAAFHIYRIAPEALPNTTTVPIYLLPPPNNDAWEESIPREHHICCRRFARLLAAMPAGRHHIDVEVRVLFEDGNRNLVGYHPASKTVAESFAAGPRHCLGPSEVLARGEFILNMHRRDRQNLVQFSTKSSIV